jgi:hypothetical protein
MTDEAMSPLRQRMIEDMTIRMIASKTHKATKDFEWRDRDAAIVVSRTRSSNQLRLRSLWPVRPEGRCEAHNVKVVAHDIFATPNYLKSHGGRKLLSPFSNIRAVTSKLCTHSRPTAGENHLARRLRAALKSP